MMNTLTQTQHILAVGWWVVVAFSILLYIILDGADLGAGIFSLFVRDGDERGAIMEAMAGTWDANETWLIVAGGVLFGSFPFAYGSALHYLMIPLTMVLLGGGLLQNLCPEAQRDIDVRLQRMLQQRVDLCEAVIVGACRRVRLEVLLQRLLQCRRERPFRVIRIKLLRPFRFHNRLSLRPETPQNSLKRAS